MTEDQMTLIEYRLTQAWDLFQVAKDDTKSYHPQPLLIKEGSL
jgi:hypothetical protein